MFGLVLARPSPNKLICLLAVFCIRYEVETKFNVSLTSLQYFLNLSTSTANLSDKQTKDLCLLLLYAKQYHYACKIMRKKQDSSELISKFIIQLEIEI